VELLVNSFFEKRVEQLFDLAARVENAFAAAGLDYAVVGGLAAYIYAEAQEPDSGRLTKDIDIVVRRADLANIAKAVEPFGLQYRHVAGVDMLVQAGAPSVRRAVHMVFSGEKVRVDYPEPTPELRHSLPMNGVRLVPLLDLVRMKLNSFRLKDQTHLQDLDEIGLISREIETALSPIHAERLARIRAADPSIRE
jgi:hypothetical protein